VAAVPGETTLAELRRDMARRRLVSDQIRQIEDTRLERLEQAPCDGPHAMVRLLARVIGVRDQRNYGCGADLMVPCMNACISSRVSWPSLLLSIALKIRS
jgi:hypothetical protein